MWAAITGALTGEVTNMVRTSQPHIDKLNLKPGTRVKFWRNIHSYGWVTIVSMDEHKWAMSNEYYQTKEGIRICSDEITEVAE